MTAFRLFRRSSPQPSQSTEKMSFSVDLGVLSGFVLLAFALSVFAQNQPPILQEPQTWPLWERDVPGSLGNTPEDTPTITVYMPPNTAGPMTAVIVAPGGGYRALSMNKEGRLPANFFNSLGVAAF